MDQDFRVIEQYVNDLIAIHKEPNTSSVAAAELQRCHENELFEVLLLVESAQKKKIETIHLLPSSRAEEEEVAVLTHTDDAQTRGVILWTDAFSTKKGGFGAYMDIFMIDKALQGRGIGRNFLAQFCQLVQQSGGNFIQLLFDTKLPNLANMYRKFGFDVSTLPESDHPVHVFELCNEGFEDFIAFSHSTHGDIHSDCSSSEQISDNASEECPSSIS